MAAILSFGFLLVIMTVATADFEYSAVIVDTLLDYEALSESGSLMYDLINPEYEVQLSRRPSKQGLHFYVESDFTSVSPGIRSQVDGKPYYFSTMEFSIFFNGDGKPSMKLIMKYEHPQSKETVGFVMYPFKSPKIEADKKYLMDFPAPQVHLPISLQTFPVSTVTTYNTKDTGTQQQKFIGNISLMKDILRQAKRIGRTKKRLAERYTEWYIAGPIIIGEEAFQKILDLYPGLEKYAHGKTGA